MSEPRIICVSANPAMDRRLRFATFSKGEVNRAQHAEGFAGGKAAHVAIAARSMLAEVSWIGFLGGAIGQECERQMKTLDLDVIGIQTVASTRVNLEIIEDSGMVTEILEPGAAPTEQEQENFFTTIRKVWKGSLLTISGSLPIGLKSQFYSSVIEEARAQGAKVFVDTSAEPLRASLSANANFIKTNRSEAEDLLGNSVGTDGAAATACIEFIKRGAGSAAITLGPKGLVWAESKQGPIWSARPPQKKCPSPVGCGDATMAGFAVAARQGLTGEKAIRLAAACGAANCAASSPGRIDLARVESLVPQIEVRQIYL